MHCYEWQIASAINVDTLVTWFWTFFWFLRGDTVGNQHRTGEFWLILQCGTRKTAWVAAAITLCAPCPSQLLLLWLGCRCIDRINHMPFFLYIPNKMSTQLHWEQNVVYPQSPNQYQASWRMIALFYTSRIWWDNTTLGHRPSASRTSERQSK